MSITSPVADEYTFEKNNLYATKRHIIRSNNLEKWPLEGADAGSTRAASIIQEEYRTDGV
ncbi:hypothetical protein Golomagni_01559 [Golovinomyces magnicellulatus]|nr:hypothetical protein Golomagni_01559 [Golovinomyces magnicellulatus]